LTVRGRIGLVGGSGVYDLSAIDDLREERIDTPFGRPSDAYVTGTLSGVPVAFLSRHGRGHRLAPSEINYRANVCGFKLLGCDALLSASACGSLRAELAPRQAVIPDQFIDRTRYRVDTFFGEGIVAHAGLADPVCPSLASALEEGARRGGLTVQRGGTYVCMEGPQFSTRAESRLYRSWGADVIGMTNLTEAKLAREAEICYATMALITDYDCWHPDHDDVDINQILGYLRANAVMAQTILRNSIQPAATRGRDCACVNALQYAILTDPAAIPPKTKHDLAPLIGKYVK